MENIKITIEKLLKYAEFHLELKQLDKIYYRNLLLHILQVDSPYVGEELSLDYIASLEVPDSILKEVNDYLEEKKHSFPSQVITLIMGLLTPIPSEVDSIIKEKEQEEKGKGLHYLYSLSIKNNYIQKTSIDKNIYFKKDYDDNFLEITINLSKPEKNNKDIAKALTVKQDNKYPQCLLCMENLGYAGRSDHPSRFNIRYLTLKLNNEDWFLQFSPYCYFEEHAIIINKKHTKMEINDDTFKKLLSFVKQYPTYFIGSNADLPIVGGSILTHEHYQGGKHLLPLFFAKDKFIFLQNEKVKISYLNWYNSVIRIESEDENLVSYYSSIIFKNWKNYTNEDLDIIAYTDNIRHNTITPICRKINSTYSMNLILRNNNTSSLYKEGIFHAHKEYHHIKQEGIGLIEAMGLFILPARLKRQMGYIKEFLDDDKDISYYLSLYNELDIHKQMMEELKKEKETSSLSSNELIKNYICDTCKNILLNTGVFKQDEKSMNYLKEFIENTLKIK